MSPVFGHGRLRLYLLKLLDENPRHGYEVIRLLEDRFLGLYAPSAGTVYPRLSQLEEDGLVTHDQAEGRKVYRLTDAGRDELGRRAQELDALEAEITGSVHELAGDVRAEVRASVRDLRSELTAAAKDMRRQNRQSARRERRADMTTTSTPTPTATPAPTSPAGELERAVDLFRDQARSAVRGAAPLEADALTRAHAVLDDALSRLRDALGRPTNRLDDIRRP